MLDSAPLAAVRERIAGMRKNDPDNGLWEHGWNAALNALAVALEAVTPLPAAPALTADDVRRIAREEVERITDARVLEMIREVFGRPTTGNLTQPPAQPPPAKRAEAWMDPVRGRVTLIDPGATSGWTYLTHFPGVTDAASAERMMAAMREAHRLFATIIGQTTTWNLCDTRKAADALAPFQPVPR